MTDTAKRNAEAHYAVLMSLVATTLDQRQTDFLANPVEWEATVQAMGAYQHLAKNLHAGDAQVEHAYRMPTGEVVDWLATFPNKDLQPTVSLEGGGFKHLPRPKERGN